jgi:hypothetical protein
LEEFAKFAQALIKVHTTPTVLKCIMFGVHTWVENPEKRVHSPTFGSLRRSDVQLTAVFHEQYYVLGWYQFCLGRISNLWMKSVSLYNPAINLTHWPSTLVHPLWSFLHNTWAYRNKLVHKSSENSASNHIINILCARVREEFTAHTDNNNIISPRHQHLFTTKSLDQRILVQEDNLQCWLRSVDMAGQSCPTYTGPTTSGFAIFPHNYECIFLRIRVIL